MTTRNLRERLLEEATILNPKNSELLNEDVSGVIVSIAAIAGYLAIIFGASALFGRIIDKQNAASSVQISREEFNNVIEKLSTGVEGFKTAMNTKMKKFIEADALQMHSVDIKTVKTTESPKSDLAKGKPRQVAFCVASINFYNYAKYIGKISEVAISAERAKKYCDAEVEKITKFLITEFKKIQSLHEILRKNFYILVDCEGMVADIYIYSDFFIMNDSKLLR